MDGFQERALLNAILRASPDPHNEYEWKVDTDKFLHGPLHEVVHKLVHSLNDIGFEIVRKPRIVYREKSRDVHKSNTKA